jgi:uncharacterized membrane protein YfcA
MGFEGIDWIWLLVFGAFVAGFVDSVAGGGGLVTVPALLLAGLSPVEALATNKLQGLFGAGTAAISYAAKGHVDLRTQWMAALIALAASALGALAVMQLPPDFIRPALPVLLLAIAAYFALRPRLDDLDRSQRMGKTVFMGTCVPLIAFYDGFFGPGTGSFFMIAFVALAGMGLLKATAHTKLLNFMSNIGGFAIFALAGAVAWKVGLMMGLAQIAGARLGSAYAMRFGGRLIKPLLIVTCIALAIRLMVAN